MLLALNIMEWCKENATILICVAAVVVAFIIVAIALSVARRRSAAKRRKAESAKTKPVEETAVEETKPVEDTAVEETQPVEETAVEETKPVEETVVEETQPVEETAVEETQPIEETEAEEIKPVEETSVEEAQSVEETAVEEIKPVEETSVEEAQPVEETPPVGEDDDEDEEDDGDENFGEEDEEEEERLSLVDAGGVKVVFRYQYSFMARLIQSSEEVQRRYGEIRDYIASYAKVKSNLSWKQVRIYTGRKTLAMLLFKGKKLCISLALNPEDYEDTKYRIIDVSEVKRFEKTPVLLKLTSPRKVRYAKELLSVVFGAEQLEQGEVVPTEYRLPYQTTEELININLVKLLSNRDKVHASQMVEPISISDMIRDRITLREAELMVSDEVAAAVYEQSKTEVPEEKRAVKRSVTRSLKGEINIDTLSDNFNAHDTVTLEVLKQKKLVPQKIQYIKVLARGVLDKPLVIEADDFSLNAIKMIMLTGGKVKLV